MMRNPRPDTPIAAQADITVLHCFDAYLRMTENWIFRLLKHQVNTRCLVASARFLDCPFGLPKARLLRSPIQPKLAEDSQAGWSRRCARALATITYPLYLLAALRGAQVDVVHSHFAQVGWRYRNVARHLRAKHVVSFYGWDYVRMATVDPSWRPRLAKLYAIADCFVCEGPHGARLLVENGCPTAKIRVARLGVEARAIPFFQRDKRPGALRLLQIASYREKKGHIDTVTAFAAALERHPDMHLTLVGAPQGKFYDSVTQIIQASGIAGKITLVPGVAFSDLHAMMKDHHVFIHPSRHASDGDCEGGAPVVLLDAQATGMPVISTTHCDIPEEVVDGVTGVLAPEGDHQALVAAISRFYAMDGAEYATFSEAARGHVEANFDASVCAADLELAYRELLSGTDLSDAAGVGD